MTVKNKKVIYEAWIKSHILYGIAIYGNAKDKEIKRLQKIQNKLVKILFANKYCFKTKKLSIKHQILDVKQLWTYWVVLKNFFKMKEVKNKLESVKTYPTTKKFKPLMTKNKFGEKSMGYYVPHTFNKLPGNCWGIKSYKNLKLFLRNWVMDQDKN